MKSLVVLAAVVVVGAAASSAFADSQSDLQADAARLAGSIVVGGKSFDYLQGLTDGIGARLTGSAAHARAAAWCAGELKAAGVKEVKLENFTIGNTWERGSAEARIVAPMDKPLHLLSSPWSPSTKGAVRGEVVLVDDMSPEKLAILAPKLKGKIVVVDSNALFKPPPAQVKMSKIMADARAAKDTFNKTGVLAVVWGGNRPLQITKPSGMKYGDAHSGAGFASADLGMEDFKLLQRLAEKGPVTLELKITNKVGTAPAQVPNVVGEIRGSEKPDEWVIVTAHLDSWDLAQGAQDNGSGSAEVLEAARAIAALGKAPKRSIRFILFAGEEQGLLGSRGWVRAHLPEMDKIVLEVNTDSGAGAPKGWYTGGREDLGTALKALKPILVGMGGGEIEPHGGCGGSDHASFFVRGVPAITLYVDASHYDEVHHLSSDTLDKVSPANLAYGAAVVAVTAWAAAEAPERWGARIDDAAVDELLKKDNAEECRTSLVKEP